MKTKKTGRGESRLSESPQKAQYYFSLESSWSAGCATGEVRLERFELNCNTCSPQTTFSTSTTEKKLLKISRFGRGESS